MAKPTILIVDDETEMLNSLSVIFEDQFTVLTANNGLEGLSITETKPLSLLLVDLQMPEMNGIELIENLRSANNNVPILVLTGNSCHDWAMKCADSNIQGYIKKPVDTEKLICKVNRILGIEDYDILRREWKQDYDAKAALLSGTIRNALKYITQHYKSSTREEMAQYLEICPEHLSRKFGKECGIHLTEYVSIVRINKSKEYLQGTNRKISSVAAEVGIPDVGYFCKLFKKHCGVTPEEFRNQHFSIS